MSGRHRLSDPAVKASLSAPLLGGLYLLLTSTTVLIPGIWPYDAKRILQFALLLILFSLPLVNSGIRTEFLNQLRAVPVWLRISLLTVVGLGLLSVVINAQSFMHGINSASEVVLLSLLGLAILLLAACRQIAGSLFDRLVIGAFAITGLVIGAQELAGVLAAHAGGADFTFRISLLYFSWPRFYNQVQAWMLMPLAGLVVLFPRNRLAQIITLLAIGLQWYIILMTGARGLVVSVAAGLLFAILFLPAIRRHLLIWHSAGLILGILVYGLVLSSFEPAPENIPAESTGQKPEQMMTPREGLYGNQDPSSSGFYAQSIGRPMLNSSGRIRDWKTSLSLAAKNPWLGIGPNNLVCTTYTGMSHPHNFPLQLAAEWGIPAALIASLAVLLLLKSAVVSERVKEVTDRTNQQLFNLFLVGTITGIVYSTLSGVMVMPASQTAGLLVCGTLLGLARPGRPPPSNAPVTAFTLAPALCLGLFLLGVYELSTMAERSALLTPQFNLYPRIWQDAMVCRLYTGP